MHDTHWGIAWVTVVSAGLGAPRAVGHLVGQFVGHSVGLEWATLRAKGLAPPLLDKTARALSGPCAHPKTK